MSTNNKSLVYLTVEYDKYLDLCKQKEKQYTKLLKMSGYNKPNLTKA